MTNADVDERIIGTYHSGNAGPLLWITAAVHGNEPSGVIALKRVFEALNEQNPQIKGTVVGVIGNTKALQEKVRFIDEDLNRTWTDDNLNEKNKTTNETREMFQIIDVLEKFSKNHDKRYFIDCHTTSSDSLPYISVQEVGDNDAWAQQFPIHRIRGFSDIVDGTIDGYFSEKGLNGFTVEAGQHESKASRTYHEGVIWFALENVCALNMNDLHSKPEALIKTKNDTPTPKTFKIIYRFGLEAKDDFKMNPGFENFQPISKGEPLATLNGEPITSNWDAFIFMPLYQAQGNDGFFVVAEVPQ
ncbi:MAG: succinylglutamate desuccinylase/aspartoacylase family protein [Marinirhabdus sp.]|nr:succinylglutamate desuccinylase/aspartoacylase family protein [Marinirhabdus sp.]